MSLFPCLYSLPNAYLIFMYSEQDRSDPIKRFRRRDDFEVPPYDTFPSLII